MIYVLLFVGIFVAAFAILAVRDARRYRLVQEARPLEDRIADIRKGAAFTALQLQGIVDRRAAEHTEAAEWISPVIAYSRRLETLAATPDVAAEEIERLAEEASGYLR